MNLLFAIARAAKSAYNVLRAIVGLVSLAQTLYRFSGAGKRSNYNKASYG